MQHEQSLALGHSTSCLGARWRILCDLSFESKIQKMMIQKHATTVPEPTVNSGAPHISPGHRSSVFCSKILDLGAWFFGCFGLCGWLICCWLFVLCWLLFVIRCLLFVVCCSLFSVCCSLLVVRSSCLLFVIHCLLFFCLLFVALNVVSRLPR